MGISRHRYPNASFVTDEVRILRQPSWVATYAKANEASGHDHTHELNTTSETVPTNRCARHCTNQVAHCSWRVVADNLCELHICSSFHPRQPCNVHGTTAPARGPELHSNKLGGQCATETQQPPTSGPCMRWPRPTTRCINLTLGTDPFDAPHLHAKARRHGARPSSTTTSC